MLPPNAPPRYESVDSFFEDILQERNSKSAKTKQLSTSDLWDLTRTPGPQTPRQLTPAPLTPGPLTPKSLSLRQSNGGRFQVSEDSGATSNSIVIAQNQVKLVHDDPERTIIEQIDTEPHLVIRQIREYLRQRLNVNQIQLI